MPVEILDSRKSTKIILLVLIGAVILFTIILPFLNSLCTVDMNNIYENLENINGGHKIDTFTCSPQCCKFTEWPLPKALRAKGPLTEEQLKDIVPTNFFCGNGDGNGCPCISKDDFNYLRDHAGNGVNKDKCM
jgi:hypothetical protein